jgi:Sap, sulfolipid-1-addressing protein
LNQAIGDLLPAALAVALSPIPIVAVVLVLAGPKARTAGPAFAVGWVSGLVAVSAIVVLVLGTGNDPNGDAATGVDWLKVANPKNLALTLAASATVAESGLNRADTAIAIGVFIALGAATVAGSVLFYLVAPGRAALPLAAVRQFMSDYNAVIMTVVVLLIAAKLLGDGVGGL